MYMFMRMWKTKFGACRNIGVTRRQYSPLAMRAGIEEKRNVTSELISCAAKTTTLTAMIAITAGAVACSAVRAFGADLRASATHSGQCWPTEAGIAQRPQIGRSHREQRSLVGVLGCP